MHTSPLTLHRAPAAGFDAPFDMLDACHERIVRMLGLLQRLHQHLLQHGSDEQARQAASDVMHYFDIAGPAHHEDEERHLFPALAASGDVTLKALVVRLQAEHQEMEQCWAALRLDLVAVRAGRAPSPHAAERWAAFATLYTAHVQAEDTLAYPAGRHLVGTAQQAAMGSEMAQRRGLVPPAP